MTMMMVLPVLAFPGKKSLPPPSTLFQATLLALLFLLTFSGGGPGAKADNPCETVAANPNVGTETIRCIGRLNTDLLVMTNKWNIWQITAPQIAKEDTNKPINSIYFGTEPPVPIEKKWPEITTKRINLKDMGYNNDSDWFNWPYLRAESTQCAPGLDANGEYLFIFAPYEAPDSPNSHYGSMFDIDKKINLVGQQSRHPDTETRWISSSEPGKMYIMTQSRGFLEMILYGGCDDNTNVSEKDRPFGNVRNSFWWSEPNDMLMASPPHMGYVREDNKCKLEEYPPYHTMCRAGADQVYLGKPNDTCKRFTTAIFNGFVDKGHFYLFAENNVISFPEAVYHKKETATIRVVPYKNFIRCSVNPHPRVIPDKKKALTIGLIVALALILLICCLCILLCLVREAMARRKRKGKKGGRTSKGKKGFFGGGTARSGGLLTPGALSKKFSSVSKRSTGGLTPGKKLTTAGGGGSMRTKRSKGPSKSGSKALSGKGASRTRRSQGLDSGGTSKRKLTAAGGGGGGGPSHAVTGRSKMTRASKNHSKSRKLSRGAHGASNKATERSKLKNK